MENKNNNSSQDRFQICRSCPDLVKAISVCRRCGCYMPLKVKLEKARCPIGKW